MSAVSRAISQLVTRTVTASQTYRAAANGPQAAVEVHFGSRLVPTLELSLILLHMEFLTRSRIASPFSYTWTPTTLFGALQAI